MTLVDSSGIATWRTLTRAMNEIKTPNTFLRELLIGGERTSMTEDIEYGIVSGTREVAPYSKPFAEGLMFGSWSESSRVIRAPGIRLKRPFTPLNMFQRRAGTVLFVNDGGNEATSQLESIAEQRARDMLMLEYGIQNAEEYQIAQWLQGTFAYSDAATGEAFSYSLGRNGGNAITPSVFLDDATPANVKFHVQIMAIKRLLADVHGQGATVTDCICGTEASTALMNLVLAGGMPGFLSSNSINPIVMGSFDLTRQFNAQGVIFIGTYMGINFWEYGRTATLNGASVNMIRAKYMEFINRDNSVQGSDRTMWYAPIPDIKTLKSGQIASKRFSKAWEVEDPSAEMLLAASRPLAVFKKPNTTVSFKAVSG